MNLPEKANLEKIYGENSACAARFQNLADNFARIYKHDHADFFTSPGRTEIIGNHVDHNGGKVIAGSINLDTIGAAAPNGTNVIHITSEGYRDEIVVDLDKISRANYPKGTFALVAGMMEGAKKNGFQAAGFDAYVSTNVIAAAGVSSSASFEMLICVIIDYFFNDSKMTYTDYAKIGQYAENVYFGKPCGLMDQMACAVGGLIYIDFFDKANPVIKQVPVDFEAHQYSLCIVDTKGSHADLTDDYAAIPVEMKQVANYFGEELLSRVSEEDFISKVGEMRASGKVNDRAVLRALHFYTEQDRVAEGVAALENQEFDHFLDVIKRSGDSSFKLLQNIYSAKDPLTQNVSIALGFSEKFIGKNGVCRVHGGGFAGTIQAFVKNAAVAEYKKNIESIFGEGACHVLKVRPYGGIKVVE